MPGRHGFQAEDIQWVKASRQEGWHFPRCKPILVWRSPRRRNGKFALIQGNEPFSGLPDNASSSKSTAEGRYDPEVPSLCVSNGPGLP